MSGRNPRLSPLESRKQLLIAESELNRAQLVGDMAVLRAEVRTLTERGKSFRLLTSTVAVLVAGLLPRRPGRTEDVSVNPPWIQKTLKYAGLISTLWLAFRARRNESKEK